MNGNINDPSINNEKSKGVGICIAMLVIVAAFSAISVLSSMLVTLVVASAAAAYLTDICGKPAFSAVSIAIAFGVSFLLTGSAASGGENSAIILMFGAFFILCKKREIGFFKSSVILGAALAVTTAAVIAVSLKLQYGNIIEGAKQAASAMYSTLLSNLRESVAASGGVIAIPDNQLEELLSITATMLPGILAVTFELSGAAIYMIFKLFYRIFGKRFGKSSGEYRIPQSAVIFFAFSFILSMIFSIFEPLTIPRLAAINICLALAVPTFFDGAARLIRRIKNPPEITMPDGSKMKRSPVFLIAGLVLSAFLSLIFPIAILLAASVIGTVKDIILSSKKKDE